MDRPHRTKAAGGFMVEFRKAVAEDLRLLAHLHDAEPDACRLEQLRAQAFQDCLGLKLMSPIGQEGLEIFDAALRALPQPISSDLVDALGAEYADIYLTYAYRASPCESVWFDDDGLERQEPMFQVREWYRKHETATSDPRKRPDDHLVFQLLFVAQLVDQAEGEDGLRDACRFLDSHLLRWLGQFCGRAASRCQSGYFAGLLLVTGAYMDELRDLLARALDAPRPDPVEVKERRGSRPVTFDQDQPAFVPGTGPGW